MLCPECERWSPDGTPTCECGKDLWEAETEAVARRRLRRAMGLMGAGGLLLAYGLFVTISTWAREAGPWIVAYGAIGMGGGLLATGLILRIRARG